MNRYTSLGLAAALLVTATFFADAQTRTRRGENAFDRGGFSRSRSASTAQPAFGGSSAAAQTAARNEKETAPKPAGPQVDVEIVFLEITSANTAKKPLPKLTGDSAAVNTALAELKKNGQLKTINRLSLSAIDGRKATSQVAGSRSISVSIADRFGGRLPRGAAARAYSSRSFGTTVSLTPTVEDTGGIVLQVQFEKSWLQGGNDGPGEAGESTAPPSMATVTTNSTLRLSPGQFAVLSSADHTTKTGTDRIVVLATAVVKSAPKTSAKHEFKIFTLAKAQANTVAGHLERLLKNRKLTIVADERTNSLIVKGPEEDLRVMEAIIQRLDQPSAK